MILSDKWKPLTGQIRYAATGKDYDPRMDFGYGEMAFWKLASMIDEEFGPAGATSMEIYQNITGPLGLSTSDTVLLIRAARREGYLKTV